MKTILGAVGVIVGAALVLVLVARVVGFDPGVTRPGMWITGEVVTEPVTDWSFAAGAFGLTRVQTRQWFLPILAHSVTTTRFHVNDRMYLASGYPAGIELPDGRHWNRNVVADPDVRIGIDGKLYDVTLVYVTDPSERDALLRKYGPMFFAPGFFMHIWRVEPRDAS